MSISNTCTTVDSVSGRRPGIVLDTSGCHPAAGQPNDWSREWAYAFLCSTAVSGDNRNLPAGRKPERVKRGLRSWDIIVVIITRQLAGRKVNCVSIPESKNSFLSLKFSDRL